MSQFLTPRGAILDETGIFDALTPQGLFVEENTAAAGLDFDFKDPSDIALLGDLSVLGDVDYTLPASPTFEFDQVGILHIDGVVAMSTIIESGAPVVEAITAQYLTPFGGILEKLEGDAQQLLLPHRGSFVDSFFSIEFVTQPQAVYLTPVGSMLTWQYNEVHQYLHPLEVVVDGATVPEVYDKRAVQYLTPFGGILEKVDGSVFQFLLPSDGSYTDDNFELAPVSTAYELIAPVIAFQWQIIISGDAVHDAAGPAYEVEGPLWVGISAALGVTGQIETRVEPFDIEGGRLEIAPMTATMAFISDLQYGIPTDIPHAFAQVGAFTAHSVLAIAGDLGYTLRPDEPHDIAQVGTVALSGTLKVLGQIQSLRGFELLTQPIGMVGVLGVVGDFEHPFPSIINILQVGEIQLFGALTFGTTTFRFDSFTEGLPRGWYVDGPILETVPNPNYGTAYGNAFFRRWTWKGYDPAGTMVAASGSEQDCFAQTLAVCQSRHEDWRELAR